MGLSLPVNTRPVTATVAVSRPDGARPPLTQLPRQLAPGPVRECFLPCPIPPSRSPQPSQAAISTPNSADRPPANLQSTRIRARTVASVTSSPPSAILAPSIGGFGLSLPVNTRPVTATVAVDEPLGVVSAILSPSQLVFGASMGIFQTGRMDPFLRLSKDGQISNGYKETIKFGCTRGSSLPVTARNPSGVRNDWFTKSWLAATARASSITSGVGVTK